MSKNHKRQFENQDSKSFLDSLEENREVNEVIEELPEEVAPQPAPEPKVQPRVATPSVSVKEAPKVEQKLPPVRVPVAKKKGRFTKIRDKGIEF